MDFLKKYFPLSFTAKSQKDFLLALVFYAAIQIAGEIILDVLRIVPILGRLMPILTPFVGVYVTVGLVLCVLVFLRNSEK